MDIFEYSDVHTPSRTILQEEEEIAVPSASGYLRPAVCVWNKKLIQKRNQNGGPSCKVLVIATCPSSCALIDNIPGKQLVGTVIAPGVSLAGATSLEPQPGDATCCAYALAAHPDALLLCCRYPVARERAAAWARSVLGQVEFEHAVCVGSIPAEQFRGQGDASQEELIFLLRTRTAAAVAAAGARPPVPLLPTGTVVGGLPAALLSHCQVRGLSAELLVLVEMVADGRAALATATAAALKGLLAARGAEGVGAVVGGAEAVSGVRKVLGAAAAKNSLEVYI